MSPSTEPENAVSGMNDALIKSYEWLAHIQQRMIVMGNISCFIATIANYTAIIVQLTLFIERAHSVVMIQHSMNDVNITVKFLNSGQIPILFKDQPLFYSCKNNPMELPSFNHGEDRFPIMFGGHHIEI